MKAWVVMGGLKLLFTPLLCIVKEILDSYTRFSLLFLLLCYYSIGTVVQNPGSPISEGLSVQAAQELGLLPGAQCTPIFLRRTCGR